MGLFSRKGQDQATPVGPSAAPPAASRVPGLDEFAATQGWQRLGPSPINAPFDGFVHSLSLAMVHEGDSDAIGPSLGDGTVSHVTTYVDSFSGQADGRQFSVTNAYTSGRHGSPVSVALSWFPVMAQIVITPQEYRGLLSFGQHSGIQTGDPAFDGQFSVVSQDETATRQVLSPATRSLLLQRDDWCFVVFGYQLLSVGKGTYGSVGEVTTRLTQHQSLLDSLPADQRPDSSMATVTLADGTTASQPAELSEAFARMTPDQRMASLTMLKDQLEPQQMAAIMTPLLPYIRHGGRG